MSLRNIRTCHLMSSLKQQIPSLVKHMANPAFEYVQHTYSTVYAFTQWLILLNC